jgi:hypothetical protein
VDEEAGIPYSCPTAIATIVSLWVEKKSKFRDLNTTLIAISRSPPPSDAGASRQMVAMARVES